MHLPTKHGAAHPHLLLIIVVGRINFHVAHIQNLNLLSSSLDVLLKDKGLDAIWIPRHRWRKVRPYFVAYWSWHREEHVIVRYLDLVCLFSLVAPDQLPC